MGATACQSDASDDNNAPDKEQHPHDGVNLFEQAYVLADTKFLSDACQLELNCDCCSGILVLNEDSSFYYKDICLSQWDVLKGKFSFEEHQLILKYDPIKMKVKNNGPDGAPTVLNDSTFTVSQQVLDVELCGDRLVFRSSSTEQVAVADSTVDLDRVLNQIQALGF